MSVFASSIITRDEALQQLDDTDCVVCDVLGGAFGEPLIVARATGCVAVLPRFAVRRGHAMVALTRHVEHISELSEDEWLTACGLARRIAIALEALMRPLRCYVASLGTARGGLPMTSPHVHLHVVPLYDRQDKPSDVFTWERGVHVATESEWQKLRVALERRLA